MCIVISSKGLVILNKPLIKTPYIYINYKIKIKKMRVAPVFKIAGALLL